MQLTCNAIQIVTMTSSSPHNDTHRPCSVFWGRPKKFSSLNPAIYSCGVLLFIATLAYTDLFRPKAFLSEKNTSFLELTRNADILRWSPFNLDHEDRERIIDIVRLDVPTYVSQIRRQLTAEIAFGLIRNGIAGDFLETGVAAGGTCIIMLKVLQLLDPSKRRRLFAADSFEGLPNPTEQDLVGSAIVGEKGKFAHGLTEFQNNLERFDVWDESRIVVLKGWFSETLSQNEQLDKIAFLRLDGDLYSSTMDVLVSVYDKVVVGGIIYVDDYGSFNGCKKAIDEFRSIRNITAPLMYQYLPEQGWSNTGFSSHWEAVWWIKQ